MKTIFDDILRTEKACLLATILLWTVQMIVPAQTKDLISQDNVYMKIDSTSLPVKSAKQGPLSRGLLQAKDTTQVTKKTKRDWSTWKPDTKRALWLSIVLPGAGQIYNRKYWKLPIVYGGFVGCIYAMKWNNQMYHDYSQGYMDLIDNDPQTHSYDQFLHLGQKIDDSNKARYKDLFSQRKDRYRRWRDLSFFSLVGVYALSIIDAYVDASLSEFDISNNLSLRVSPTILNRDLNQYAFKPDAVGIQCRFDF